MGDGTDSRRPGVLPLRPSPAPDETLVSWVMRVAAAYGLDVLGFLEAMKSRFWSNSPMFSRKRFDDSGWGFNFVETRPIPELMATATGIPLETIMGMRTGQRLGRLLMIERSASKKGERNSRHPDAYCPECMAERFYLRRDWRLSFVSCCPVHHRCLIDLCSQCGADLDFYGKSGMGRHVGTEAKTLCHRCRFDLTLASHYPHDARVSDKFLLFQDFLVEQYHWNADNHGSPAAMLLDGLIHLTMAIAKDEAVSSDKSVGPPPGTNLGAFTGLRHRCSLNKQLCFVRYRWLHRAYEVIEDYPYGPPDTQQKFSRYWKQFDTRAKRPVRRHLQAFASKIFPAVLNGVAWEWEEE